MDTANKISVNYKALDQYLEVMFKLQEGFVDFKEGARSLDDYLNSKGDDLPSEIRQMMRELLEEKRKKHL